MTSSAAPRTRSKLCGATSDMDEQDQADDDPGNDREEAEEQPILRPARPAGTRGRHRLGLV